MTDDDISLPLEHCTEYDAAARWSALRGLKGVIGDPLPPNMAQEGALKYINADPDAFAERVRQFAYEIACNRKRNMRKLRTYPPGYMDVEGAAKTLGVGTRTIRSWTARRLIPFYRIGHFVYFKEADLIATIESNFIAPQTTTSKKKKSP